MAPSSAQRRLGELDSSATSLNGSAPYAERRRKVWRSRGGAPKLERLVQELPSTLRRAWVRHVGAAHRLRATTRPCRRCRQCRRRPLTPPLPLTASLLVSWPY